MALADGACTAKTAVAGSISLSAGRLRKHEFCEFLNAVVDAMPAGAGSFDSLLGFLRSRVTVSRLHRRLFTCL